MVNRTALITTVFNEIDSIQYLLESILKQARLPDELIIVDGGSTDGTPDAIRSFYRKHQELNGTLIEKKRVNISQGRNIAISASNAKLIAVTDGGCQLAESWFEKIIIPLDNDNSFDVVSGFYAANARTYFQTCAGAILVPKLKRVNAERFMPSSRSIAFTKKIWKTVGGYPEHLYNAEDTLFNKRMLSAGAKMKFVPEAIVHWTPRSSLRKLAKQFYNYRKGDIEAGIWKRTFIRSTVSTSLLFGCLLFSKLWFAYFAVICGSSIIVLRRLAKHDLYLFPGIFMVRIVQEISETAGLTAGLFNRLLYGK